MEQIDRIVHEPVRLRALTLLSGVQAAEFSFLLKVLNLTNGNLSVHMRKLEEAGYVEVSKEFVGRTPRTRYAITEAGRGALREYWRVMEGIQRRGAEDAK
jgi:DNA-binding transcriptional ArsR family regulator